MPSPFPGMNPFLEQADAWEDFHQDFLVRAREALMAEVGESYVVKVEARLYLHELSAEERRFFGRAAVAVAARAGGLQAAPATCDAAPVQLVLPAIDVERQAFLEIRDRRNRRIVTVVESLSPANKTPGADRDAYLGKRGEILAGQTHLVELDLRRGGTRPHPPDLPPCDYYALVSRYEDRPNIGFWPIALRERLPVVRVPLAAPDPDAHLDLQAVLDRAYDAAGFGTYIYSETPEPPLSADDADWAATFLHHRD
jgi:hypothetical protein